MQQAEKGHLYFGDVQYVVLDEADTMFDKGFGPEVRSVLNPVRKKEQPAVCILVLATLKKVSLFTRLANSTMCIPRRTREHDGQGC